MSFRKYVTIGGCLVMVIASCTQLAGISRGLPGCDDVSDCPIDVEVAECRLVTCEEGACVVRDAVAWTPVANQVPHDCKTRVCDGAGGVTSLLTPDDFWDDGNPCTRDYCVGDDPTNEKAEEVPCYTGDPFTEGKGPCKAGVQRCDKDKEYKPIGGCEEEVLPGEEMCDDEEHDEDCDGLVNEEGEGCFCGDGYLSVGEVCDDRNDPDSDDCSPNCRLGSIAIAAGATSTCAVLVDGSVKCWGSGVPIETGFATWGDMPPPAAADFPFFPLGAGRKAKAITMSPSPSLYMHSCILLEDGQVICWGNNVYGQLGIGAQEPVIGDEWDDLGDSLVPVNLGTGAKAVSVVAGVAHTCALLVDGKVKCWGRGSLGQLGLGDKESRGLHADDMGDNLPAVDLGTGRHAQAIAAGHYHSCALLDDGSVKCWGRNKYGQLGFEDESSQGDHPGEMGDDLPPVGLLVGKKAVEIAAYDDGSCALLEDGSVGCWGRWLSGFLPQAGELGAAPEAKLIVMGGAGICGLFDDGKVRCWNAYSLGQPNGLQIIFDETATALSLGAEHMCVIMQGGVKCRGQNSAGQLGVGGTAPIYGDVPFVAP